MHLGGLELTLLVVSLGIRITIRHVFNTKFSAAGVVFEASVKGSGLVEEQS
jgi:hypothetical protein